MVEYEITYTARPELDEAAKDRLDEAVDKFIADLKGRIIQSYPATDAPGSRRRLHYPLMGKRVAWLRAIQAELEPEQAEKLRLQLRKQSDLLRAMILKTPLRKEVPAAILDQASEKKQDGKRKDEAKKPAKEVTMSEVEEKIEQVLDEEVK